jgi:hypothetical protein
LTRHSTLEIGRPRNPYPRRAGADEPGAGSRSDQSGAQLSPMRRSPPPAAAIAEAGGGRQAAGGLTSSDQSLDHESVSPTCFRENYGQRRAIRTTPSRRGSTAAPATRPCPIAARCGSHAIHVIEHGRAHLLQRSRPRDPGLSVNHEESRSNPRDAAREWSCRVRARAPSRKGPAPVTSSRLKGVSTACGGVVAGRSRAQQPADPRNRQAGRHDLGSCPADDAPACIGWRVAYELSAMRHPHGGIGDRRAAQQARPPQSGRTLRPNRQVPPGGR